MPLKYASDKIVAVQKRSDEIAILNILANFHQKSEAVLRKFNRKAPCVGMLYFKKRLQQQRCFLVDFTKCLRMAFLAEHL